MKRNETSPRKILTAIKTIEACYGMDSEVKARVKEALEKRLSEAGYLHLFGRWIPERAIKSLKYLRPL